MRVRVWICPGFSLEEDLPEREANTEESRAERQRGSRSGELEELDPATPEASPSLNF